MHYLLSMPIFRRQEKKKEVRYILSIDGGGMRGIIPGYILGTINRMVRDSGTERPLYSFFDLVIGTSTGALLAFALSADSEKTKLRKEEGRPYPVMESSRKGLFRKRTVYTERGVLERGSDPEQFESLYIDHRDEIFPRRSSFRNILYPILQDKYPASDIEGFLDDMLGETELSETFIPSAAVCYSPDHGGIYLMRSWDSHGFLMKEALRATTAAPMYFPPSRLTERDTGSKLTLVDGGLCANNPALIGYTEARKLYPEADEFRILSLSTCKMQYSTSASWREGGLASWATEFTRIADDAQQDTADRALSSMPDVSYTRIWAPVLTEKIRLDDTAEPSVSQLRKAARETFSIEEEKIRKFAGTMLEEEIHSSVRIRELRQLQGPSPEALPSDS